MTDDSRLDGISWHLLGAVSPESLVEARMQLHWAAQIVSAVGTTLLPARDDDSQTNFEWLSHLEALAGEPVGERQTIRAAIAPGTLTLHVLDKSDSVLDSFTLDGRTYNEGIVWMGRAVEKWAGLTLVRPLARRELELPSHSVGDSDTVAFTAHRDELAELSRYFANADALERALAQDLAHASAVRCWPHHFDHALLLSLEPEKGFAGKAMGIGMEPGDDSYAEPYFYVNPYPRPDGISLPVLAAGDWHVEGWVGAILKGSEIVAEKTPEGQRGLSAAYLNSAIAASHELLL